MHSLIKEQIEFYHSLKSKNITNGKKILFLDYDYYLQKRDLKILLGKYQEVIIIPLAESIKLTSNAFFKTLLKKGAKDLTIIYNPAYEEYFGNKFELNFQNDSRINILNVFEFCEKTLKKCYVSDNVFIINPTITNLKYFGYIPRALKKSLDWSLGSLIYILSQPLWILSAINISVQSSGPIFFKQDRVGIKSKNFKVIKFRSMVLDAEVNGAQFSKKNDDRIFQWGKTMRSTRIDELPQLFNILKGELSLIGPRPERKVFIDTFEEYIPQYNVRHVVKPGISGYAQIMYPYGAGLKDARHKLMYDLYYIKNWTLMLEFKILFLTAWTVLSRKGI
jgi:lipopolysaccharide/colanic/teichoic acid biosynthesis glycosyltransferase